MATDKHQKKQTRLVWQAKKLFYTNERLNPDSLRTVWAGENWTQQAHRSRGIPLLLLLLLLLELLQVLLGHLDDVAGLLLRGEEGEGAGAAVQRGARGGPRQILPEVLAHGLTFKKFGSGGVTTLASISHCYETCWLNFKRSTFWVWIPADFSSFFSWTFPCLISLERRLIK